MNPFTTDTEVTVTAVRFGGKGGCEVTPSRIELGGRSYTLTDGIRCQIRQGRRITRLFDMTDGARRFRLSSDGSCSNWRLVAMS